MQESIPKSEKELAWEAKLAEIETWVDATGRGLDEGIKETVAAFNLLDLSTKQSCEGHTSLDEGHTMWPWVSFAVPAEPDERFVGENEAFKKVAEQQNLDLKMLKRGEPEEVYWDVLKKITRAENVSETPEYAEWDTKNKQLQERAQAFLDEFYRGREIVPEIALMLESRAGGFELKSEKDREIVLKLIDKTLSDEEKRILEEKLPKRQAEMRAFTEFLKSKYFNS